MKNGLLSGQADSYRARTRQIFKKPLHSRGFETRFVHQVGAPPHRFSFTDSAQAYGTVSGDRAPYSKHL